MPLVCQQLASDGLSCVQWSAVSAVTDFVAVFNAMSDLGVTSDNISKTFSFGLGVILLTFFLGIAFGAVVGIIRQVLS